MPVSDDWVGVGPQDAGLAPDLDRRLEAARHAGQVPNVHGVVVVRGGKLVLERYWPGHDESWGWPLGRVEFTADTLHDLRSVTKSIVGLLYGVALEEGLVPRPEEDLFASFPELPDLAADRSRNGLMIEHVLTMTMGLEWDEGRPYTDPANSEIAMEAAPDRYRYILDRPIVAEPGERWIYNGGGTALLGRLIATRHRPVVARLRARAAVLAPRDHRLRVGSRAGWHPVRRIGTADATTRSGSHWSAGAAERHARWKSDRPVVMARCGTTGTG